MSDSQKILETGCTLRQKKMSRSASGHRSLKNILQTCFFDSSVIDNADECTEDGESFDFQPEELHDFTLSWVRFSVAPLDNGAHGAFIDGYNTPIQIWPTAETGYPDGLREYIGNPESYQCAYVIISPGICK